MLSFAVYGALSTLKTCRSAMFKPLTITFNQCGDAGVFTSKGNRGNIVPLHKKRRLANIEKVSSSIITPYL